METKEALAKWDNLFVNGRIAEALNFMEGEIAAANAVGAWEKELTLLNEVMGYNRSISNYSKAWECAERAAEIMTDKGLADKPEAVTTFLNIANIYRAQGAFAEAMEMYKYVECIYLENGLQNDYRMGGLYNNLAVISIELNALEDAIAYGERAVQVLAMVPGSEDEQATVYCNLAGAFLKREQQQKALELLERAEKMMLENCSESPHYCAILGMKAYVVYMSGDLPKALECYERAMAKTLEKYGANKDYERMQHNCEEIKRKLAVK